MIGIVEHNAQNFAHKRAPGERTEVTSFGDC